MSTVKLTKLPGGYSCEVVMRDAGSGLVAPVTVRNFSRRGTDLHIAEVPPWLINGLIFTKPMPAAAYPGYAERIEAP